MPESQAENSSKPSSLKNTTILLWSPDVLQTTDTLFIDAMTALTMTLPTSSDKYGERISELNARLSQFVKDFALTHSSTFMMPSTLSISTAMEESLVKSLRESFRAEDFTYLKRKSPKLLRRWIRTKMEESPSPSLRTKSDPEAHRDTTEI